MEPKDCSFVLYGGRKWEGLLFFLPGSDENGFVDENIADDEGRSDDENTSGGEKGYTTRTIEALCGVQLSNSPVALFRHL